MKIATWNVNSIRTRLEQVINWLSENPVDVLCLQETKVVDQDFPLNSFENLGYHLYIYGQKAYNGVALISRQPLEDVSMGFCSVLTDLDPVWDEQKRVISGVIDGVRIVNLYVPNGSSVGSEKYEYKPCGRMYQTGYGFQNMKKVIRNLVFKDYYNVDINSSFFRMASDLFSKEWSTDLRNEINSLLQDKDNFYAQIQNPREFKINLLSILLGSRNIEILNSSAYLRHLNNLLNDWMTPAKRRKYLATHLFKREQEYVKELIEQLQEMPHVLIHDGFIIKNNYQLDEKIWSIKKL